MSSIAWRRGLRAAAVLTVAVVAGAAACGNPNDPSPPPPPSESVVVSGVVSEAEGGAPLAGATVSVGGFETTSSADGGYELRDLATGSREIQAVLDGFETYANTVELQAGSNRHDIGMLQAASISGAVVADETGDPVAGVTVRATLGQTNAQTTSGPDGTFELRNLPPGAVELRVTADGFNPYLDSLDIARGPNGQEIRLLPQTLFEQGAFAMYLPTEVETVKGVFFYIAGREFGVRPIIRWVATGETPPGLGPPPPEVVRFWGEMLPELARRHGLAVLGGLRGDIAPSTIASVFGSFSGFATQTGHAELAGAALLPLGYSFGGCFVSLLAAEHPDRIIGFQVNRGSCPVPVDGDLSAGALQAVPAQFINAGDDGSISPGTRADIEAVFEANRQAGAPWALAVGLNWTHDIEDGTRRLLEGWLDPVLEMRLPEEHTGDLIQLRPVDPTAGWLGNPETFEIAAYEAYVGDPGTAVWLPSEETAVDWQEVVTEASGL
jgi:hypothetical protein